MQRYIAQVSTRRLCHALRRGGTAAALLRCPFYRYTSTTTPSSGAAVLHGSQDHPHEGSASSLSIEFRTEDGKKSSLDEDEFDELEAASQELHDLCYTMIAHLRCADPNAHRALFERRIKRGFREPQPEQYRRLLHGYGDRSLRRRNNYRSHKDFEGANRLYLEWGEKVLVLLTQPVLDRILKSAGKGHRDLRSDGVHRYRRPLERATWRTFPHRWFKHAPFEVQQLRADIPDSVVQNTRFYRDHATLRYLFTLMEPQHFFREKIEHRMMELTRNYDVLQRAI